MQLLLDLDLQILVVSAGSEDPLRSVVGKRGPRSIVAIKVVQQGSAVIEPIDDLLLKFVAKQKGEYDQTPLVSTSTFTWIESRQQYEGWVNYISTALNNLFGVQLDPVGITSGDETTDTIQADEPHGLTVGRRIWFPELTGGEGLTANEAQKYFVVAVPTSTTFQVSSEVDGTPVNFTTAITDGSFRTDPVDVASLALAIEVGWRYDSADPYTSTENEVNFELRNNYLRDTDGEPGDPLSSAALVWLDEHGILHSATQSLTDSSRWRALNNQGLTYEPTLNGLKIKLPNGSYGLIPVTEVITPA